MIVTLQTQRVRTLEHVRVFIEGSEAVDFVGGDREGVYAPYAGAVGVSPPVEQAGQGAGEALFGEGDGVISFAAHAPDRPASSDREDQGPAWQGATFATSLTSGYWRRWTSCLTRCRVWARELLRREFAVYGNARFDVRLAGLSNMDICTTCAGVALPIAPCAGHGITRALGDDRGAPPTQSTNRGLFTVHDHGVKTEVTQYEYVGTVAASVRSFPFKINGFHADNGSVHQP